MMNNILPFMRRWDYIVLLFMSSPFTALISHPSYCSQIFFFLLSLASRNPKQTMSAVPQTTRQWVLKQLPGDEKVSADNFELQNNVPIFTESNPKEGKILVKVEYVDRRKCLLTPPRQAASISFN